MPGTLSSPFANLLGCVVVGVPGTLEDLIRGLWETVCGQSLATVPGTPHGVFHRQLGRLEKVDGHFGVELIPHRGAVQIGETTKFGPAAGLAPDGNADHAFGVAQLLTIGVQIPADKGRILAATFVFAAGLNLEDLLVGAVQKKTTQRQETEEIRFPRFHRDNEIRALDIAEGAVEGIPVPDQIADGVGAHAPSSEDQEFVASFEERQKTLDQGPRLAGGADHQTAFEIASYIEPVTFADAQNHAAELGEIVQQSVEGLLQKG